MIATDMCGMGIKRNRAMRPEQIWHVAPVNQGRNFIHLEMPSRPLMLSGSDGCL